MDNQGERDNTFAKGARGRVRAVHILGPGELGEGAQRYDRALSGFGGEGKPSVRQWTHIGLGGAITRASHWYSWASAAAAATGWAGAAGCAERGVFPDRYSGDVKAAVVSQCDCSLQLLPTHTHTNPFLTSLPPVLYSLSLLVFSPNCVPPFLFSNAFVPPSLNLF